MFQLMPSASMSTEAGEGRQIRHAHLVEAQPDRPEEAGEMVERRLIDADDVCRLCVDDFVQIRGHG